MATIGRDERRRRIMERGSDRLALITGLLKNLERTSSLPSASPSLSFNGRSEIHFNTSGSEFPNREAATQQVSGGDKSDSHLSKSVTTTDVTKPSVKTQTAAAPPGHKASRKPTFFSSRRLNACIIASEVTRAKCSFIIGVLVLVFHFVHPLLGIDMACSESGQGYRPVYMIAVTDVTVVLFRLFQEKGNVLEEAREEKMTDKEDEENWRDAFKLLERGITGYQAIRAMFIDCSIYFIVVICGLSLT